MAIIALIAVYILFLVMDTPSILKLKRKHVYMSLYMCILLAGFIVSLLQIKENSPISPAIIIENIVKSIFNF